MAGPGAAGATAALPPPRPHRPATQQQKQRGGLAGPELQLVEERLLELQFGLLSLHEEEDGRQQVGQSSNAMQAGCGLALALSTPTRQTHPPIHTDRKWKTRPRRRGR